MNQLALGALVFFSLMSLGQARTIDEIIAGAASSVSDFEIMEDISSPTVQLELDMILTRQQYHELMGEPEDHFRSKRKAIRQLQYRWPNSEIPYRIESNVFSTDNLKQINLAIREWEINTCIRFRPAQSRDSDYVSFGDGGGCSSYVGRSVAGQHPIALAGGCRYKSVIAHEIGHAVGFFHEQNRPDRDSYVIIHKQNMIHPKLYHNFKTYSWSYVNFYNVPYDYSSIMHYGGRAFSANGQHTIKTRDPAYQDVIGSHETLSFRDIKMANRMYECSKGCDSSIRCPGEGFLGKDCKCYCPANPIQLCDSTPAVTERPTVRPTSARPTTATCEDLNQYCLAWAQIGYCRTNMYVGTYCKRSCNLCGRGTTPAPLCTDVKKHCPDWAEAGFCEGIYGDFMSQNCQLSCKICVKEIELGLDGGNGAATECCFSFCKRCVDCF